MGRKYTASYAANAQTTAIGFEILAPSDSIVVVHSVRAWQTTELGDAAEEILALTFTRGIGSVTSGSGGATPDVHPIDDGDAAFGGTVECRNTTVLAAGSGTLEVMDRDGWNVRVPYVRIYTPEERPIIGPSEYWEFQIAAPADSTTIGVSVTFEEWGG